MRSKPHHKVSLHFYRRPVLNPKRLEYLMTLKGIFVQQLEEAIDLAKETIRVNWRGAWSTPEPYDYFFKLEKLGTEIVKIRENAAGTDGETGAARRRGELPILDTPPTRETSA